MDIIDVNESRTALEVRWRDGSRSRFPYQWLRDNCTCAECGTTVTGARFLRLVDIPADVRPEESYLDECGRVAVLWSAGGHFSLYDPHWLSEHCPERSRSDRTKPVPWDRHIGESLPCLDHGELADTETAPVLLIENLFRSGFVLIKHVPATDQAVVELAGMLGEIRAQSYAPVFDIWQRDNQDILSNTESALAPHVDEPFRSHPPGLFLLHCLEASPDNEGASLLVDGFMLGKTLKTHDPVSFTTLCEISTPYHRRRDSHFEHYAEAPVFSLDTDGEITRFCFAERSAAPLILPEEMIERIYAARRALLGLAYNPEYQVRIKLSPGDALLIDNYRLMHGREAFRGKRHLRQCNLDRDGVLSRYRLLCRKFGRRPVI